MTFSKGLLIATLSLALFAFSAPVNATTETKPAEAAKTEAAAEPSAAPTGAPAVARPGGLTSGQEAPAMARIEQKVDMKNLPQDVTPLIPINGDTFILAVGETKVLTAARPRKCPEKDVPIFENTKLRLPTNELISYTDGGVRERFSRRCGVLRPARVILATGVKKGTQKLQILGSTLTVLVK